MWSNEPGAADRGLRTSTGSLMDGADMSIEELCAEREAQIAAKDREIASLKEALQRPVQPQESDNTSALDSAQDVMKSLKYPAKRECTYITAVSQNVMENVVRADGNGKAGLAEALACAMNDEFHELDRAWGITSGSEEERVASVLKNIAKRSEQACTLKSLATVKGLRTSTGSLMDGADMSMEELCAEREAQIAAKDREIASLKEALQRPVQPQESANTRAASVPTPVRSRSMAIQTNRESNHNRNNGSPSSSDGEEITLVEFSRRYWEERACAELAGPSPSMPAPSPATTPAPALPVCPFMRITQNGIILDDNDDPMPGRHGLPVSVGLMLYSRAPDGSIETSGKLLDARCHPLLNPDGTPPIAGPSPSPAPTPAPAPALPVPCTRIAPNGNILDANDNPEVGPHGLPLIVGLMLYFQTPNGSIEIDGQIRDANGNPLILHGMPLFGGFPNPRYIIRLSVAWILSVLRFAAEDKRILTLRSAAGHLTRWKTLALIILMLAVCGLNQAQQQWQMPQQPMQQMSVLDSLHLQAHRVDLEMHVGDEAHMLPSAGSASATGFPVEAQQQLQMPQEPMQQVSVLDFLPNEVHDADFLFASFALWRFWWHFGHALR